MSSSLKNRELIHSTLLFVLLSLVFSVPALSQSNPANPTSTAPKPQTIPSTPAPNPTPRVDSNPELPPSATPEEIRQAQIESDTKKLYQLSAELRAEVAKTYKESLSLTVLKKAQEIEKLARSLKVRMNQEAAAAARNRD
jgi:beta-lactamase class A